MAKLIGTFEAVDKDAAIEKAAELIQGERSEEADRRARAIGPRATRSASSIRISFIQLP
jgi:hypothetical protein